MLAQKLNTKVAIKQVRIDFLNHVLIQGLYIEDRAGDTLLYAGEARVRITDWFIIRKDKPVIHYVGLHDAYGHLYRTATSDVWNYQFVVDAFDPGKPDTATPKKQNDFEIDLEKVDIRNVRFHMDDAWVGSDYDIDLGNVQLAADDIDLKKKRIKIESLLVENTLVSIRDYVGGRPPRPKKKTQTIDTTAFNTDNWAVSAQKLQLNNSAFRLNSTTRPAYPEEFDPAHIDISGISLDVSNIRIVKDTIRGHIAKMTARDRCGIQIKQFTADVTVSPNASICENLLLQTNNSKLQNYYAMHYTRFPDFTDYIHKVRMVGQLHNSYVDARDVAYFAPVLRKHPTMVSVSGNVNGTVDKLTGKNLLITDNSTFIKGDLSFTGLPDIYTTFIRFEKGEIYTTNNAIFRYAPELKNDPAVAFDKLQYVHYKGNFAGFIDNFVANGVLSSNLGTITSDIRLNIPDLNSKRAVYSGAVNTSGFDIGTLLRTSVLGKIAFNASISGTAFDPENAAMKINGTVPYFEVNNYRYQNITAEGTLAKKKFDGNLLVDDANLALAFYGSIDFSDTEMTINARANLLKSNLHALNLTRDSILATADFDLNFIGDDIDNFLGSAKLYNINLIRNAHRLDVDSVYLYSSMEDGEKLLTLESNDITARIKGHYQLSTLHHSVQFYVAGYLPNYISPPAKSAPPQDLSFSVRTRNIDSLFAVLLPSVDGFSNTTINGSLNTTTQQLSLKADIPFGSLYGLHLHKVNIEGTGSFRELAIKADVEKFVLGNDVLSASMSVNTRIGNDSMNFQVATKSPDAFGTVSINGRAFASGDSLYLNLLPSEFFLNQTKWEVPAGNSFVFGKDLLIIRDLWLRSGTQEISAFTSYETTQQALHVNIKNLDVSMLGNLAGIAAYQPTGRINGNINFKDLFSGMQMSGNIRATEVQFGQDTLGIVYLVGNYDAKKKIITLDPQSGIYHQNASVRASGSMSFDSTNNQQLSGLVQFTDAKLAWIAPFVTEFLSKMSGTLNGDIRIAGSALKPDIDGDVNLTNAATRIEILGTYYRIPSAKLHIDNNSIDFGRITIYDVGDRTATLTGGIAHDRFRNMRFNRVTLRSPEFEVLNLKEYENNTFYGNLTANVESMTITGTFDDIRMTITASPAQRSHIFIPVKSTSDIGTYTYVSFKSPDTAQVVTRKSRNKFSLTLIGKMNPLAEMTLVLDPSTGDMINARGNGVITLNVPSDDDIKMYGNYEIEEGDYTFTLRQLAFRRNFIINSGSKIGFNGPLSATKLDINAIYTRRGRLIDLLQENEKQLMPDNELRDAKTSQDVRVLLYMTGSLNQPDLKFKIDLPERRSEGSYAYTKLQRINQNDRELFDQVVSLLLIGSFIPPEGIGGTSAASGAINNISEMISTTASTQLTNIVNKLLGDPDLSIELKYKNYNLSDPSTFGGVNRNEVSFAVRKNLLNDRLVVELGSAYDWGRPTSANSSTSNLNLAGDFRAQYLLTPDGRFRFNAFRTSNYDVLVDRNIWRGGVGLSYRQSFNNLQDLFSKNRSLSVTEETPTQSTDTSSQGRGTW